MICSRVSCFGADLRARLLIYRGERITNMETDVVIVMHV